MGFLNGFHRFETPEWFFFCLLNYACNTCFIQHTVEFWIQMSTVQGSKGPSLWRQLKDEKVVRWVSTAAFWSSIELTEDGCWRSFVTPAFELWGSFLVLGRESFTTPSRNVWGWKWVLGRLCNTRIETFNVLQHLYMESKAHNTGIVQHIGW